MQYAYYVTLEDIPSGDRWDEAQSDNEDKAMWWYGNEYLRLLKRVKEGALEAGKTRVILRHSTGEVIAEAMV